MDNNDKILSRLDGILVLLVSTLEKNDSLPKLPTLFHQLKSVGFSNEEISRIFGKTPTQVAKISYEVKRQAKKVDKNK